METQVQQVLRYRFIQDRTPQPFGRLWQAARISKDCHGNSHVVEVIYMNNKGSMWRFVVVIYCCCCCCCCNVVSTRFRHVQNTLTPGNLIPKGFLSVEQIVSKGGVENCDNRIPYLSCSMSQCSATSSNMIQHAAKWRTTHRKTTYSAYQRINPSVHLYKASKNHSRNMSFELTPSFSVNSLWSPWTTCDRFSRVSPMDNNICGVAGFKSNLAVHFWQNWDWGIWPTNSEWTYGRGSKLPTQ